MTTTPTSGDFSRMPWRSAAIMFRVWSATEGGVDVLATGEFDLVLVDGRMPGMSGSEFLTVLRDRALHIPAILMTGYAKGDIIKEVKKLDAFVVGKPSGGHDEFWKELEPLLADALQGETEILTSLRRAIDTALKASKTNLAPRYKLLDQELVLRALNVADGDQEEAARILGVPLAQLVTDGPLQPGAKSKALAQFSYGSIILIYNNPDWTATEIAQQLGCSKAKLYRDPIINRALKGRSAPSYRPPGGFKDADGNVEAYD